MDVRYHGVASGWASRFEFYNVSVFGAFVAISHVEGDEAGIGRKELVESPLYGLFGVQGVEFVVMNRWPQLGIWVLCGLPAVERCRRGHRNSLWCFVWGVCLERCCGGGGWIVVGEIGVEVDGVYAVYFGGCDIQDLEVIVVVGVQVSDCA